MKKRPKMGRFQLGDSQCFIVVFFFLSSSSPNGWPENGESSPVRMAWGCFLRGASGGLSDDDFHRAVAAVVDEVHAGCEVAGADLHLLLAGCDGDALEGAAEGIDDLQFGG